MPPGLTNSVLDSAFGERVNAADPLIPTAERMRV